MKKLIVFLAAAAFALQVNAQTEKSEKVMEKDVPASVTSAFQKTHTDAKMVDWKKTDSNYEVEFDETGTKKYIEYNVLGKEISSKVKIKESELPASATTYINQNYKDVLIKEYYQKSENGSTSYIVKAKDKKITFDSKGNYKKTEDCKE